MLVEEVMVAGICRSLKLRVLCDLALEDYTPLHPARPNILKSVARGGKRRQRLSIGQLQHSVQY
jgi:hypothetical protein